MTVSENFKNISWSPYGGATGPKCNFFFKFATRSLVGGARMEGGPVAPPRATGGPTHRRDRGGLSPPLGRPALPLLCKHSTLIPSSFEPKNPEKKERGEEKGSGEALPDCALVICRLVHLAYVFFYWYCRVI